MPLVFEQSFVVSQTECDPWERMTPGAVLRHAQDISTAHCVTFGMDEAHYKKTHTVFLMSRLSLQTFRMPAVGEDVVLQTRAYGPSRAVYHRVSSIHAQNGDKLCEIDSRWVLVDTDTRRILRKEPEGFNSPFHDLASEKHDMDMPKPGPIVLLGEMHAGYSLCDSNGHINNARYADIVCDNLPLSELEKAAPARMLIFYRSEISLGQDFSLFGADVDGGYYLMGGQGAQRDFEAFVCF